jgi:2-amino-4-hydroxy-6-hydroxymethyldihydropteridine diphosphokinase
MTDYKKLNWVVITLGSNIEKEKNMPASIQYLQQKTTLLAVSPLYETLGVGCGDNPPNYFNAAALIETELDPISLKHNVLSTIEQQLGRKRTMNKNAPRTIDMDICLFNEEIFDYEGRHVPDPDLLKYAHVIVPVADLLPDLPHPETGELLSDIAARIMANAGDSIWRASA